MESIKTFLKKHFTLKNAIYLTAFIVIVWAVLTVSGYFRHAVVQSGMDVQLNKEIAQTGVLVQTALKEIEALRKEVRSDVNAIKVDVQKKVAAYTSNDIANDFNSMLAESRRRND